MTLQISISSETEGRLRRLAESAGKDVSTFVSQLVEQAAAKPALDELLAPLRQQFADSGVTDQELVEQITAAQQAYRAEQKKTA
jgi:predicted transcriptional regulator